MKTLVILTVLDVALLLTAPLIALPMVAQTPFLLALAIASTALAPLVSAVLAIVLAIYFWRRRTRSAFALLAVAFGCAALARTNLLEFIFAPAQSADAVPIADLHDIRDSDMVIGVVLGGRARAYPVRYLAYHHMLNDQLGSVALLPTY
jgi:hypothetical protein